MATSSESVHDQEYVDFDEYIDIQLRKTGSTIKSTDVLTAVVGILTMVTLYLLLFVICDHWIIPGGFGSVTRGIMLAIVGSAAAAWGIVKVLVPWRRRVSGLYAASTIEKASPTLKSSLLNLVDISRSGHEIRPEIYHSIERRAALALTHVDVNETVDRRSLLRLSNVLLAVVVLFCLYWVFSPKNPATSLWRAVVPSAEVGVATRTEIFNVRPGDKDVLARSQLEITADVRGEMPAQTFLYFTTADRKFVDERVEMRLENDASRKFRCVLTGDNGGGILQNITYRIVAGDATTPEYTIHVIQPPAATIESIRLDSPEYTHCESVLQMTGAIDALEGTRVTLKAHANMPLRAPASLQFFDDETASKRAEEIPVRITDGTKLDVEWKLEIRSDGTYPHYYRLFCTNAAGESDPSPSLYSLAIRPDQAPEITLRDPKTDLELPANAVVPLVIEARDPDFVLRYIDLNVEKDGSPVNGPTLYEGNDQQFKTTYNWSLRDYHFRPKETVTYWLQAKDNRQPIANTTRTPKLRIRIVDPVPEDQVKKNLEMAQKRQKEEMDRSEAERASQDKPDDDSASAEAGQKQQHKTEGPKDKQQLAAQRQRDELLKARQNENVDDQSGQGQDGQGQSGQGKNDQGQNGAQQSKGDRKAEQDGGKENGSAAKGENEKQELNPDDPADTGKVLQKLLDKERRDREEQSNSGGAGPGRDGSNDPNKTDKNGSAPGRNEKPDQNQKKTSGSPPGSGQTGKPGEKNAGQSNQNMEQTPSPGSKSQGEQNREPGKGETKDRSQAQKETKEKQSATSGGSKPESTGGKPQNQNSSEPNKEGAKQGAATEPKSTEPKSSENNGPQNAEDAVQKNSANAKQKDNPNGPSDSGQKKEKTDALRDDKSAGKHEMGAPNQDHRRDSNLKQEQSSKDESRNDSSNSGNPPDRTRDAKPSPNNNASAKDRNGADAGKENQGQEKSERGPQNSPERGSQTQNDQDTKNGPSSGQSPGNERESASAKNKNGEEAAQKGTAKQQPGTPQPVTQKSPSKEPGSKDVEKGNAGNQDQRDDASRNGNVEQKGNAAPKRDSAQKSQSNQQTRPENGSADGQTPDANNKEKADKANLGPDNKANRQSSRPDDQQPKSTLDKQSAPTNPKATEELSNTIRDKNHPQPVRGNSEVGPAADAQQNGAQKDAASRENSRQESAEQKTGGQKVRSERETGAGEKATAKERSDARQKAEGTKSDNSQAGQPGQDQKGQREPGQQPQGQEGQQGQNQQGQNGSGKDGRDAASNATDAKGGKQGQAAGQSTAGRSGGGFNNGTGSGQGEPLEDTTKQANLDYAKKATDLVLRRLENQLTRGQVDKKVEEELGWTKDQIRRFVERMRNQAQAAEDPTSPAAQARRLQFEETLKSLNLRSPAKSRTSREAPKTNDFEMEAKRSIPPPEYRDLYNAFTKSLAKPAPSNDKK